MVEYLKPIPEEEDAMPLYRDALAELSPFEFPDLVPRDELERRRQKDKGGEHERWLYETWSKDPKSVSTAELEAWVADSEAGLKKVILAQQRPACSPFQTEYRFDSLLSEVQACRSVARAAMWQTSLDARRSEFDRPIQSMEAVLRLSRDLRNKADAICSIGEHYLWMACAAGNSFWRSFWLPGCGRNTATVCWLPWLNTRPRAPRPVCGRGTGRSYLIATKLPV